MVISVNAFLENLNSVYHQMAQLFSYVLFADLVSQFPVKKLYGITVKPFEGHDVLNHRYLFVQQLG